MPQAVCDAFEAFFTLTYDSSSGHYLVNDTARDRNRKSNMLISIQLGNTITAGTSSVNIDLPYDSFDLEGNFPMFPNATRYFPIRRAVGGVNVIGRVFLQEAMLVVDYGRRNFTIAPARFASPLPAADIVAIAGLHNNLVRPNKVKALAVALPIVSIAVIVALAMALWHFCCKSAQVENDINSTGTDSASAKEADSEFVFELESPLSPNDPTSLYPYGSRSAMPPLQEKQMLVVPVELPSGHSFRSCVPPIGSEGFG